VKVTKQVVVPFLIGKYIDEVLCDMVPIQTSHILLGRPWQYDRKTIHDGVKNRYTIVKDGKTITLVPLTPKQMYDDQIKLKSEHEAMGRENQGEEQGNNRTCLIKLEGLLNFFYFMSKHLFGFQTFFFGKLTYVLKEEDTNIIRGIPQIYNDNRNIKQQMATG